MITLSAPRAFSCCSPAMSLDREFGRMVNSLLDAYPAAFAPSGAAREGSRAGVPPINVFEDANAYFVEAELPGFKLGDLDITMHGGELTITGSRETGETEEGRFIRRERPTGRFTRTLRLGSDIDSEKVAATLEHGVLTVTLPKAEAAKPRKITIS